MSLITRALTALSGPTNTGSRKNGYSVAVHPVTPNGFAYNGTDTSDATSIRILSVYAAVRNISVDIASLPVDTFVRDGKARREVQPPGWLYNPNPEMNSFTFWEAVMASLLLDGNAYIVKLIDNDQIVELWPLNPGAIEPERVGGRKAFRAVGTGQLLSDRDILHIPGFGLPGALKGLSPIGAARQTIATQDAIDAQSAGFWANAARPSGTVNVPADIADEDFDDLVETFVQKHGGSNNAGRIAFLKGAKFEPLTVSPADAEFVETRKMLIVDIARLFRLPPHKLQDLERSTFSNIEHQGIEYIVDTIRPWLVRLERHFNALLPEGQFIKFNERALLRGDMQAEAESYRIGIEAGYRTPNEVRQLNDLPPSGEFGADKLRMPLNQGYAAGDQPLTLKQRFDLFRGFVALGFDPADSARKLDLPEIAHTGITPNTLHVPYTTEMEGLNVSEELK